MVAEAACDALLEFSLKLDPSVVEGYIHRIITTLLDSISTSQSWPIRDIATLNLGIYSSRATFLFISMIATHASSLLLITIYAYIIVQEIY